MIKKLKEKKLENVRIPERKEDKEQEKKKKLERCRAFSSCPTSVPLLFHAHVRTGELVIVCKPVRILTRSRPCLYPGLGVCVCVCVRARVCVLSYVQLFQTSWTMAHQAALSKGFSRHEYQSG